MKRLFNWQMVFGIVLLLLSAAVYYAHYLIFHDAHHIFIYLIGDIGFVFIEVLLVTLILHKLLAWREKNLLMQKLNMVIGVFFSEVGTELLKLCSESDVKIPELRKELCVSTGWTDKEFLRVHKNMRYYQPGIVCDRDNCLALKKFLLEKRPAIVTLLENPNLLEHETFSHLLWTVLHVVEELSYRDDLSLLPDSDLKHLRGDIERAYRYLIVEWLDYMRHLKHHYPYLFSLALRINPFNEKAGVLIK